MTTGSKIDDQRSGEQSWSYSGGNYTYLPSYQGPGYYYKKTWAGGDLPSTKPTYEKLYFKLSNGDRFVSKRRVGATSRIKRPDHDYTCSIEQRRMSMAQYSYYIYGGYVGTERHNAFDDYAWDFNHEASDEWGSNDTIALLGKLRTKVAGSDFNAGVALAESHKALAMLAENATRIRKALTAVKRGRFGSAVRELGVDKPGTKFFSRDNVSQNWLMLQYGWLPLVNDMFSAAQYIATQLNLPLIQTYRVRRKRLIRPLPFTDFHVKRAKLKVNHAEVAGQLIARLEEVNVAQLSGLLDPASVLLELTPWSFVADWAIPIGNYLHARGLAQSLTGTFVTTITRRELKALDQLQGYSNGVVTTLWEPHDRLLLWNKVNVSRTVSTVLSVPLPSFKPLSDVPSWKRAANAVALLVQAGKTPGLR